MRRVHRLPWLQIVRRAKDGWREGTLSMRLRVLGGSMERPIRTSRRLYRGVCIRYAAGVTDQGPQSVVDLEIEATFAVAGRGIFVAARLLNPHIPFTMSETPKLGDIPIERWIEVPRKLGADGKPRFDYVVFRLVSAADRTNIRPGQRIVLH